MRYPDHGLLLIISGPSGGGKSTVVSELLKSDPVFRYSVSATTRAPRDGEVDGVSYRFMTEAEFAEKEQAGEFLETNHYTGSGAHYGTPRDFIDQTLTEGGVAVLEIDVNGGRTVKAAYPDRTLKIFLMPPTIAELEERLRSRPDGKITEAVIQSRLTTARTEIAAIAEYDEVVVNYRGEILSAVRAIRTAIDRWCLRNEELLETGKYFLGE